MLSQHGAPSHRRILQPCVGTACGHSTTHIITSCDHSTAHHQVTTKRSAENMMVSSGQSLPELISNDVGKPVQLRSPLGGAAPCPASSALHRALSLFLV
eukprot:2876172-Rhodomonas_salina.2